jgi:hypothetical protein
LVEDKKDVSAFANYKDDSGATETPKPQETNPEMKVEATSNQGQPPQTHSATMTNPTSGI